MALTKTQKIDKIEVVDTGDWKMVQVRMLLIVLRLGLPNFLRLILLCYLSYLK